MSYEKLRDPEWLRQKYETERLTTYDIADELGCATSTVLRWMDRAGIERRTTAWCHAERKRQRALRQGSARGYIEETYHYYPVTKFHECDDPYCPARRDADPDEILGDYPHRLRK